MIRLATAADTDFILSLVPRFVEFNLPKGRGKRKTMSVIRADLETRLRDASSHDHFFIAVDAARNPAGFSHLQIQTDFVSGARACHISNLAVVSDHESQGIGRALLAHAQKWAKQRRCKLLTLSVFPGNGRARALYERAGFNTELLRMVKPVG